LTLNLSRDSSVSIGRGATTLVTTLVKLSDYTTREEYSKMPTTVGVLLLFLGTFTVAILWATQGETDTTDHQGDVTGAPGKTS
jgi:hypothetical protein